jgi:hypothetical protein
VLATQAANNLTHAIQLDLRNLDPYIHKCQHHKKILARYLVASRDDALLKANVQLESALKSIPLEDPFADPV